MFRWAAARPPEKTDKKRQKKTEKDRKRQTKTKLKRTNPKHRIGQVLRDWRATTDKPGTEPRNSVKVQLAEEMQKNVDGEDYAYANVEKGAMISNMLVGRAVISSTILQRTTNKHKLQLKTKMGLRQEWGQRVGGEKTNIITRRQQHL